MRPSSFFDSPDIDLYIQNELNRHGGNLTESIIDLGIDAASLREFIVELGVFGETGNLIPLNGGASEEIQIAHLINFLGKQGKLNTVFWENLSCHFSIPGIELLDCITFSEKLSTIWEMRRQLRSLFGYPHDLLSYSSHLHTPRPFTLNNLFGHKMSGASFHVTDEDYIPPNRQYTNDATHAKSDRKQRHGRGGGRSDNHREGGNGGRKKRRKSKAHKKDRVPHAETHGVKDHYQTLGLNERELAGLSRENFIKAVKKAYRSNMVTHHADRHGGNDDQNRIMRHLIAARDALLNQVNNRPSAQSQSSDKNTPTAPPSASPDQSDERAEHATDNRTNPPKADSRPSSDASSPEEPSANEDPHKDDQGTSIAIAA